MEDNFQVSPSQNICVYKYIQTKYSHIIYIHTVYTYTHICVCVCVCETPTWRSGHRNIELIVYILFIIYMCPFLCIYITYEWRILISCTKGMSEKWNDVMMQRSHKSWSLVWDWKSSLHHALSLPMSFEVKKTVADVSRILAC